MPHAGRREAVLAGLGWAGLGWALAFGSARDLSLGSLCNLAAVLPRHKGAQESAEEEGEEGLVENLLYGVWCRSAY